MPALYMWQHQDNFTILLFVTVGDQNICGLLHPQIEEFHSVFSVLVDLENLMF